MEDQEFSQPHIPTPAAVPNITVRRISEPLYQARGWMKLLGILAIIYGVFMVITIWGILICWLPIWMGMLLLGSSKLVELAYQSNNEADLIEAQQKLKTFFTIQGVLALIGLIVIALSLIFAASFLGSLIGGAFR